MYVTLGIILITLIWAAASLGQKQISDPQPEILKRHMEMREEIHKRMRDKLLHGLGPDDDLFKDMDKMFDDMMSDSLKGFDSFAPRSSQFQIQWSEDNSGRTLAITPKSKDQNLDIKVENGFVTIKGVEQNSSFSSSFNVPQDCDPAKVKMDQKEGKILMHFPYKKQASFKDDRRPLPVPEDAVEI